MTVPVQYILYSKRQIRFLSKNFFDRNYNCNEIYIYIYSVLYGITTSSKGSYLFVKKDDRFQ